tara:strand:- start:103 stop:294 length:192 start_codon:yes stop_codon:yes gene_type:complete
MTERLDNGRLLILKVRDQQAKGEEYEKISKEVEALKNKIAQDLINEVQSADLAEAEAIKEPLN